MREPNVTVYGSKQCPDTERAMQWLAARGIAYDYKDVDATPEYNHFIAGLNNGKRVLPTIRINNETLFNPPEPVLEQAVRQSLVHA